MVGPSARKRQGQILVFFEVGDEFKFSSNCKSCEGSEGRGAGVEGEVRRRREEEEEGEEQKGGKRWMRRQEV